MPWRALRQVSTLPHREAAVAKPPFDRTYAQGGGVCISRGLYKVYHRQRDPFKAFFAGVSVSVSLPMPEGKLLAFYGEHPVEP